MPNVKRSDAKTCQKHPKAPCRPTKLPSCGPSIYGHIGFREAFPWWWNEEKGVAATARTGSQRNNRFQIGKLWSTHSLDMNCVSDSQPWQHQVRAPASQKKLPKKMCQAVPTLYTMHCSSWICLHPRGWRKHKNAMSMSSNVTNVHANVWILEKLRWNKATIKHTSLSAASKFYLCEIDATMEIPMEIQSSKALTVWHRGALDSPQGKVCRCHQMDTRCTCGWETMGFGGNHIWIFFFLRTRTSKHPERTKMGKFMAKMKKSGVDVSVLFILLTFQGWESLHLWPRLIWPAH